MTPDQLRKQFPALNQKLGDHPLVYLDNAATTQKPEAVINAMDVYYREYNSNVHRASHRLASRATDAFENVREQVRVFINAESSDEIIFTKGTTEAINLIAQSYGGISLNPGDKILVSTMEHHANLVPWQMVAEPAGAEVLPIPLLPHGDMDMEALENMLDNHVRVVCMTHASNVTGTINPIRRVTELAHEAGAIVVVDGAQAVAHLPVDVQTLDADFYVFSGHKMYGPTGVGVLYGKRQWLDVMPPYQGGGEMIETVSFEGTTFNQLPFKFEAGTPPIAEVIGLGAAIEWLNSQDRAALGKHERQLMAHLRHAMGKIDGLMPVAQPMMQIPNYSFIVQDVHHHDLASLLDEQGVAVRSGHHCAMPFMQWLDIDGAVRVSLAAYNTVEDIYAFEEAMHKALEMLR